MKKTIYLCDNCGNEVPLPHIDCPVISMGVAKSFYDSFFDQTKICAPTIISDRGLHFCDLTCFWSFVSKKIRPVLIAK